ncbi:DNA-directed RNA polymerase III subunit C31 [Gnomoniopsis sp. IMI 355080]|nr:DNA-directed RNA polymerase III subunit C31 [Gnomoniopsis sp. IMI 355080]
MSRGGRGGFRGGKKSNVPWEEDKNLKVDYTPSETFPPYNVPIANPVTNREKDQVRSFLLFREQVHDGPFYTATRSYNSFTASGATTPRAYGQEQINQRYGVNSKGTVDPFTAVDMPTSRMKRPERALPDFGDRPFSTHLFPPELHITLNDEDHPGGATKNKSRKKKTMTLSKVTTLRTAEEIFHMPDIEGETAEDKQKKLLEQLAQLDENAAEDEEGFDLDDEQGYEEEMDEVYDDEDGGDYDAELYFDGGDNDDMDDGGGDDGVY